MNTRPITETAPLADLACRLLRTPSALATMDEAEARCVVGYMRLVNVPRGTTVFREGDSGESAHLLLILSGEVVVGTGDGAATISILGPGNIIGEMALLDGSPRSTTCTAVTALQAAGLTRKALALLIEQQPKVGAKLMVALSNRMSERLRALGDQLRMYAQVTPAGEKARRTGT